MKDTHQGRKITGEAFDRVVEHLVVTLTELGVPGETIATIGGALGPLKGDIVAPVAG